MSCSFSCAGDHSENNSSYNEDTGDEVSLLCPISVNVDIGYYFGYLATISVTKTLLLEQVPVGKFHSSWIQR